MIAADSRFFHSGCLATGVLVELLSDAKLSPSITDLIKALPATVIGIEQGPYAPKHYPEAGRLDWQIR